MYTILLTIPKRLRDIWLVEIEQLAMVKYLVSPSHVVRNSTTALRSEDETEAVMAETKFPGRPELCLDALFVYWKNQVRMQHFHDMKL